MIRRSDVIEEKSQRFKSCRVGDPITIKRFAKFSFDLLLKIVINVSDSSEVQTQFGLMSVQFDLTKIKELAKAALQRCDEKIDEIQEALDYSGCTGPQFQGKMTLGRIGTTGCLLGLVAGIHVGIFASIIVTCIATWTLVQNSFIQAMVRCLPDIGVLITDSSSYIFMMRRKLCILVVCALVVLVYVYDSSLFVPFFGVFRYGNQSAQHTQQRL